ncbi:hypothetical protein [Streptomyces sp. NPDC005385]|uniref:hypothetical protein n=1 Tax=Streptomyces sp. NPDC005385 TaxID=3157039 RepID=UPI0033B1DA07
MNHQPREQYRQQRCGRGVRASGPAGGADATTRAKARAVTVTDTPWAPDPAGPALHALPSPGPALHPAGPHGQDGQGLGPGLGSAADLTPGRAAELAVAAESPGGQARELARRLALSLSPEARGILLSALTEADPHDVYDDDVYGDDEDMYGYDVEVYEVDGEGGYGDEDACDGGAYASGGGPLAQVSGTAAAPSPAGLCLVPARPERGAGRVSGRAGGGAPAGVVRLRFADVVALDRAGAAFGAGPGGGAVSDPATLTLQIPGEAGTETLRAVLEVLDAAALTAESLTVHSHELDDVFAALTGLP